VHQQRSNAEARISYPNSVCLSCHTLVLYQNGSTHRHDFFTTR